MKAEPHWNRLGSPGATAAYGTPEHAGQTRTRVPHALEADIREIPADELELFQQGRASDPKRSAAVAFAKKVIETHGKVSDADLEAVRQAGYIDSQILEIAWG